MVGGRAGLDETPTLPAGPAFEEPPLAAGPAPGTELLGAASPAGGWLGVGPSSISAATGQGRPRRSQASRIARRTASLSDAEISPPNLRRSPKKT